MLFAVLRGQHFRVNAKSAPSAGFPPRSTPCGSAADTDDEQVKRKMEINRDSVKKIVNQLVEFDNAIKPLIAFRRKNPIHGYFEVPYLFRGQSDKSEIVATLFRDITLNESLEPEAFRYLLQEEYREICNWISRANSAGLKFNFDIWNYTKRNGESANAFIEGHGYLEKHYPVMALSRHHGCKNRLIDFTKDPHAALFFSVTSGIKKMERAYLLHCDENEGLSKERGDKFKEWVHSQEAYVWVVNEKQRSNADIIVPDYGNNLFALAQSAVFVIAPLAYFKTNINLGNLVFSRSMEKYGFECPCIISIPYQHLPKIFLDMDRHAINFIKYFPSPDSIALNATFLDLATRLYNLLLYQE